MSPDDAKRLRAEWTANLARRGLTEEDVRDPSGRIDGRVLMAEGLPTLTDIAHREDTTVGAISNLINGKTHTGRPRATHLPRRTPRTHEPVCARVLARIEELGYVPRVGRPRHGQTVSLRTIGAEFGLASAATRRIVHRARRKGWRQGGANEAAG